MSPLQKTIDIQALTLADWLAISRAKDNSDLWGFYSWLESADCSQLERLLG